MIRKLIRVAFVMALIVYTGSWIYSLYIEASFVKHPRRPDAVTLHTVPYSWKGIIIYLTPREEHTIGVGHLVWLWSMGMGLVFFGLLWWLERRKN